MITRGKTSKKLEIIQNLIEPEWFVNFHYPDNWYYEMDNSIFIKSTDGDEEVQLKRKSVITKYGEHPDIFEAYEYINRYWTNHEQREELLELELKNKGIK